MKTKFLLLALLLLNGFTPSPAAHSSLNTLYLTHSVNNHVARLQADRIFLPLPVSPFLPAMAPALLQSEVVKMALTYPSFFQGTLLVVGTAAIVLVAGIIQKNQNEVPVEPDFLAKITTMVEQAANENKLAVLENDKKIAVLENDEKIAVLENERASKSYFQLSKDRRLLTLDISAERRAILEALSALKIAARAKNTAAIITQITKMQNSLKKLVPLSEASASNRIELLKKSARNSRSSSQIIPLIEINLINLEEKGQNQIILILSSKILTSLERTLSASKSYKEREIARTMKAARTIRTVERLLQAQDALKKIEEIKSIEAAKRSIEAAESAKTAKLVASLTERLRIINEAYEVSFRNLTALAEAAEAKQGIDEVLLKLEMSVKRIAFISKRL